MLIYDSYNIKTNLVNITKNLLPTNPSKTKKKLYTPEDKHYSFKNKPDTSKYINCI